MDQQPPAPPPEETVWEGSPSHWMRFGTYLLAVLFVAALGAGALYLRSDHPPTFLGSWARPAGLVLAGMTIIPLIVILRAFILTRCIKYRLTSQRILASSGVFSRKTDNLELYRVEDLKLLQPFFLRLVGRGSIGVVASDPTNPTMLLAGLPNVEHLRDDLRKHVEACRDRKRTRVLDMDMTP
jgi:hypothetical protein